MKESFKAYLDDYGLIVVIIKKQLFLGQSFFLLTNDFKEELKVLKIDSNEDFLRIELTYNNKLIMHQRNYLLFLENKTILRPGKIVRTKRFDEEYQYNNHDLGFSYQKGATTFKVWSPVAREIRLVYFKKNAKKERQKLVYDEKGVWKVTVEKDLENYNYYFLVKINDKFKKTIDLYAIASCENSKYSVVIDKNKTYEIGNKKISFSGNRTDAVIYEAHVRDLTSKLVINNRGEFLGVTGQVLEYLSKLKITHLQLLPINDYAEVNELNRWKRFNWGYNPLSYMTLEGSYSSDPRDPYRRINEFKILVDQAHQKNIGIVIDVVFNHVYNPETFPFDNFVPGYYYRYDAFGMRTSSSGLGNDVASERKMVKNFILQTCQFFMEFYNVDGFRFDLMGLLDIDTMNELNSLAQKINPFFIMYGEGWKMNSPLGDANNAHMFNESKGELGYFNDQFRENVHNFITTSTKLDDQLLGLMCAKNLFSEPSKSLNYLSCHDGYTLYDRYKSLHLQEGEIKDLMFLAFGMIILALGMPFIHGGDEFLRTKKMNQNSYCASDIVNGFNWKNLEKHQGLVDYIIDLITLRNAHPIFRSNDSFTKGVIIGHNGYCLSRNKEKYLIYLKKDNLPFRVEGNNIVLFDNGIVNKEVNEHIIKKVGIYVFKEI